jgi:hypothetical protein
MNRRRSSTDPLFVQDQPTWLVVKNALSQIIEYKELGPGANLREILNAARNARIADGWLADEIGRSCSFFFCVKDGVRLEVGIRRIHPDAHATGHAHLAR